MISIEDIAQGKYALHLYGNNWSAQVRRLREILKLAAPKDKSEPLFSFTPYYYCENGYWFESGWNKKEKAVDVFEVEMPEVKP